MTYINTRNDQITTTYKGKLLRYHPNGFVVNYCLKKSGILPSQKVKSNTLKFEGQNKP